jgi:uncharacterized protein
VIRTVALSLAGLLVLGCGAAGDEGSPRPAPDALVRAAERGDVEAIRDLLERGAEVDVRDARGRTAVTAAALAGRRDAVRALIAAGADVDLQDAERNNPLLVCGENGDVAMLRLVLAARPDLAATNRFGGTALIPAADRGHVGTVRALVRTRIDLDHVNRLGWTALLEAVILGDGGADHTAIVRMLVDAGADPAIADRDGVTALQHARDRGYDAIVRVLERAGQAARP